jgi:hypothetical protein
MRYLDPEAIAAKRIPTNYNARLPDVRPRRYAPRAENERWERGTESRPSFDRGRDGEEDRTLDRYGSKRAERNDADVEGKERRKRDWDDWRVGRAREFGREERFARGQGTDGLDYDAGQESTGPISRSRSRSAPGSRTSPPIMMASPRRGGGDGESDMELDADD